jgi:predicted O-methyltransferase YrrM
MHQQTILRASDSDVPPPLRAGLRGKLHRLRLFPLHTLAVRSGVAARLHARRTRKAERILRARGHDRLIASHDDAALQQDPADLVYLYDTVGARRPTRAIEFGSGQSTVFIALALHDLGHGHLWSLDADARWLANSERSLPEHLRPFVTFVHSPAVAHLEHGIPAWRYTVVPPGEWDFVLVDGPALTADVLLSSDLVDLPLAPGAIGMIDHRWRSAVLARQAAGRRLGLRYMPSLESFALKAPRR